MQLDSVEYYSTFLDNVGYAKYSTFSAILQTVRGNVYNKIKNNSWTDQIGANAFD